MHVFPGAVLEADHDGTFATVDFGEIRPHSCGGHFHRLISPDEKSDGSFGPDEHIECCKCGEVLEDDGPAPS